MPYSVPWPLGAVTSVPAESRSARASRGAGGLLAREASCRDACR